MELYQTTGEGVYVGSFSSVHAFLRDEIMHPDVLYYMSEIVRVPDENGACHGDTGPGVPHYEFEGYHTLIQWMFPTMDKSECQPNSPVLRWEDVQRIREDSFVQKNLRNAKHYMERFYAGPVGKPLLLAHRDHNHRRVTRIIESLSLLCGRETAQDFLSLVSTLNAEAGYPVNVGSVGLWCRARYYGELKQAKQK